MISSQLKNKKQKDEKPISKIVQDMKRPNYMKYQKELKEKGIV